MKVLVIDDEERARKTIIDLIKLGSQQFDLIIEAESVKTGIEQIKKHHPDLVILDIEMPDGTGFNLLQSFDYLNFKIIFVTAYEEYAIKAFEFSAIDYILKPIDPLKLYDAISKAYKIVDYENINLKLNALFTNLDPTNSNNKKLVLRTAEKIFLINTNDIIRCESDMGYTNFFLVDGRKILTSKNLKDYELMLDGLGFFRIHQSHLINLSYIDYYDKTEGGSVIMKDNSVLPLSRRKKESFLKLIEMI